MKKFFAFLCILTLSFSAHAGQENKANIVFVVSGSAAKCVAAIGISAVSFVLMGGAQGIAILTDAITSVARGNVFLHASHCAAMKNINYLQALMYAGCIVPVNEVDFDQDLVKYNATLLDPTCQD